MPLSGAPLLPAAVSPSFSASGAAAPFPAGVLSFSSCVFVAFDAGFSPFSLEGFGVPARLGSSLSSRAKAASKTAGSGLPAPSPVVFVAS